MTTTLFAGAGMSKAVSEIVQYHNNKKFVMPTAYEMFNNNAAKDYLTAKEGNFKQSYGVLSKYLRKKYKTETPNISYETVYSDLLKRKRSKAANQLISMIFEHLGGNFPPIRYDSEALQTIRIIRSFLCTNSVTNIISTNPDILLEVAVMGATRFDEWFIRKLGINEMKIKYCYPNEGKPVLSIEKGLPKLNTIDNLVKLHGSLLMLKPIDKDGGYIWPEKFIWYEGGAHTKYSRYKKDKYEICVIPPMDKKGISYRDEPYKTLLELTINIIKNTETLIFYGFGFNQDNDKNLSEWLKGVIPASVNSSKLKDIYVYDTEKMVRNKCFRCRVAEFIGLEQNRIEFKISKL